MIPPETNLMSFDEVESEVGGVYFAPRARSKEGMGEVWEPLPDVVEPLEARDLGRFPLLPGLPRARRVSAASLLRSGATD